MFEKQQEGQQGQIKKKKKNVQEKSEMRSEKLSWARTYKAQRTWKVVSL